MRAICTKFEKKRNLATSFLKVRDKSGIFRVHKIVPFCQSSANKSAKPLILSQFVYKLPTKRHTIKLN